MPKAFFYDMGLRNCIIKNFSKLSIRPDLGAMIENYVFGCLNEGLGRLEELKYWRTKSGNEVDFIVDSAEVIPVEVKYQEFTRKAVPSGVRYFSQDYKSKLGMVVTKSLFDKIQYNNTTVWFIPVWLLGR